MNNREILELRKQLVRRYGADAAQEAFTQALEREVPLELESLASLANRYRQREATWLIRHIPLEEPDTLSWDPQEERFVLGVANFSDTALS